MRVIRKRSPKEIKTSGCCPRPLPLMDSAQQGAHSMASVDYYLKIEGIDKGESPDSEYKGSDGWMQIDSWSFGAHQGGTGAYGGGGGAGKVSMQDFSFTMKVNTASPKLFLACATGEHFKKAQTHARKAGKTQKTFYSVIMHDVLVTSFQTSGSGSSDVIPVESITLNF